MTVAADHGAYGGVGPLEMGVTWTLTVLATLAVGARVYVSFTLLERPGWDLYWAILAWLTALASQGMQTAAAVYGIGNHVRFLTKPDIVQALKWDWLGRMVGVWASFFGKNVVIALMLRIQGATHPRKALFLHFIWISNFMLTVALVAVLCARCQPTSLWWNKAQPGSCNNIPSSFTEVFGLFQSSWTTASDLALAIYPVFIFWNLSMSWKRKAGICAIMGAGLIAGIVNIFKTIQVQLAYAEKDVTYNLANLLVFTSVEPWLIIICGSLPPIRALFVDVKNKTWASRPERSFAPRFPSSRKSGTEEVEIMELRTSSQKGLGGERRKYGSGVMSQRNESQEGILPRPRAGNHNAVVDVATSEHPPEGPGIMMRRDFDVNVEPRAL